MRSVTAQKSPEAVLPRRAAAPPRHVPFTVIDQAVHLLDSPAEPWGIQFELGFASRLDEDRLRGAVQEGLARHPMARARQRPARLSDRNWWWEIAPEPDVDPLRVLDCPDAPALAAARSDLYSRQVPLVEAPPVRLVLARGADRDWLLLNANHAAFDGFGCVRLMQSVARAYVGAPDPDPPVTLDEARDVEGLLAADDQETRSHRLRLLAGKVADLAVRPTRLAQDGGRDEPGYGFHLAALSEEETKALSTDGGPTVNDLLLAALTMAIDGWNEAHGRPRGRVGILVPVNVRPKDWQEDVVTNFVLESRVVTMPDQRGDGEALLRAIGEQTERIKEGGGAALIEAIGGWSSMPLWTKEPLSPLLWLTGNRLVDTALLSNLGQLKEPPDFGPEVGPVEEAWFSAPARMPCGLSIGVLTVGGRLHVSFRYRHPVFGPDAAAGFAQRFFEALQELTS